MDDQTLASGLAARDELAIRELVDRHYAGIYRFLRRLSRNAEDAEDLAQQTLIRILAGAHRFDERSTMKAWIFTIAMREFLKWRRRRPWLPLMADVPAKNDPFANVVEANVLVDAIGKLPIPLRSAFLLHLVEQLSIQEVASVLGVPEGTVKSRLHTAKQRLQCLLGTEENYVPEPC